MYAYCWSSGDIALGKKVPEGAIKILKGGKNNIKNLIVGTARLAYDNKTWLVPGIPESDTEDDKLDALEKWLDWLKLRKLKNIKVY